MKIGILGGTFDPPHNGHLALAEEAKIKFNLDEIWLIPAGDPYLKAVTRKVTHSYKRMNMVHAAVENVDWARAIDCEVVHEGPSYTSETLDYLKKEYPDNEYYFIMGADALRDITSWHNFEEIFKKCVIIAAHRNFETDDNLFRMKITQLMNEYGAKILTLPFNDPLSSSLVRDMAYSGHSYRFFVPPSVYDYIKKHHLYNVK